MSIFYCNQCDRLSDADDGCEEIGGELVCIECAEELEDVPGNAEPAAAARPENRPNQTPNPMSPGGEP